MSAGEQGCVSFQLGRACGHQVCRGLRQAAATVEPVVAPVSVKRSTVVVAEKQPKANPKASASRWAEYGRRGGRVGGASASPAKAAAAKVNGARGGRPKVGV